MGKKRVLIIYTGGTFGMEGGPGSSRGGAKSGGRALATPKLAPSTLKRRLRERVPELARLAGCDVEITLNCDSAHIGPEQWLLLAKRIQARWRAYDGVVVLHGTDTMAYTASALSFLLRPCLRPVILTGAQRPLSAIRTDARRNLISAVELAAHGPRARVNRVCVFFDDRLFQGNRVRKRSASRFGAFESPFAPALAEVGTEIVYPADEASAPPAARRRSAGTSGLQAGFNSGVLLLHVTPGFPARLVREQCLPRVAGLVLVIFSSGTAPTQDPEFVRLLEEARRRKIPVVLAAEGAGLGAHLGQYEAGRALLRDGAYWAGAMTPECAYVRTAWLLAQPGAPRTFAGLWSRDYAGER